MSTQSLGEELGASTSTQSLPEATKAEDQGAPKRGRGRAKAQPKAEAKAEDAGAPKRGRGKAKAQPKAEAKADDEPAPKKGRGKAKAQPKPEASKEEKDATSTPTKNDNSSLKRSASSAEFSAADAPESPASAEKKPKRQKKEKKVGVYEAYKGSNIPEPDVKRIDAEGKSYKAVAWNVGGLRSFLNNKSELLKKLAEREAPDVIGIMETKLQEGEQVDNVKEQLKTILPDYTEMHFSCSIEKKGYSGVCILMKTAAPVSCVNLLEDINGKEEGRTMLVEHEHLSIVLTYVPNSGEGLIRLTERTEKWDPTLRSYLQELETRRGKPVVLIGDLNVAHRDEDIWNSEAPHVPKQAGLTVQERESFGKLLEAGFVDAFVHLHPELKGQFSYWSVRAGNRPKNRGLRLDYAILSKSLTTAADEKKSPRLVDAFYLADLCPGGDHCPVGTVLTLPA
eukprot:TRINITY_DN7630_c0_g1_i2.p1 TRINITY_DN7630_c0_g1~~TRINITY_DN7630_c0_g1_i2.p1  ORF type:complete len:452 (+),score=131.48 TRINITY_DN7630_c0_g1_i2:70-1425(+)